MVSLLAAWLLVGQDRQIQLPPTGEDGTLFREMTLLSVDKRLELLLLRANVERLPEPKKSPLHEWAFEYISYGMARETVEEGYNLRIRVYNQYRKSENDPTDEVLQLLMRLWDFNRWRLNSDHNPAWHMRAVDVYLCAGGEPGAEQKILEDPFVQTLGTVPPRVNNIYVYSVPTLTDRLEFAREVAHEYGHATWPGYGGFTKPENWASGDMAERVFLMWLMQEQQAGRLRPTDMMQVPLKDMVDFYDYRIRPDLRRVGLKGPDLDRLAKKDEEGYSELLGLCSYAAAILPHDLFGKSLWLARTNDGPGYNGAVLEAAERVKQWRLRVPRGLENSAIWVPLRAGKVTGAKQLARRGDWVKVQPTSRTVTVLNDKVSVEG
jgi:hypothetical protein